MELKEGIKQINQSVTQSSASDTTLEGYMLELKDANGNLVDKQPVSKLESLVYNYLTTKRKSELADAVGGNQNGNADGFVKFINTFIDDTIDYITPMGVFPYIGEETKDRGFVFRFYSDKHTRTLEIKVCEKAGMFYRSKTGSDAWSIWKSVGINNMGVLSKSEDLNNVKSSGIYVLYTEQHPSNTPSELLSTTTSLLKVTDGESVLIQEIYPLAGGPYYRLYYKNNFKWYDWTSLSTGIPSFYKNYPDIASLSKGVGGLQKSIYQSGEESVSVKITLASKEAGDYADVYVYNYGSFGSGGGSMHKILISKTGAISITAIISNNTTSPTKLDDDSVSVPLLEYSMLVVYSNMDFTIQNL